MTFEPFDSRDGRSHLEIRVVDDLQRDPDEKPGKRHARRLARLELRRRVEHLVGPYATSSTVLICDDLVRGEDGRPVVFALWAPVKRLVVDRLPRGTAADDPAVLRMTERLKAAGVEYLPVEHGGNVARAVEARFAGAP